MKTRQYLKLATHGLRRGGQRTLVAILSVAFGVMSLVAMATLSGEITRVLMVDARQTIGGDARLWRQGSVIPDKSVKEIEGLGVSGGIKDYALVANSRALILRTPDSGHITFLHHGIGFDPGVYPLVGELTLSEPEGASPDSVLLKPGDAILTKDVARERGVSLGDAILVTNRVGGAPAALRIAGIATNTPNLKGGSLYYDLVTAGMISGSSNPVTEVHVLWGHDDQAVEAELRSLGWQVDTPEAVAGSNEEIVSTFDFMLKGAGILGLLVGGIGIANTMQVVLAGRTKEIAILKTLGYSRRDMILLFAGEAAIMGLVGSVLGVILATVLSMGLVNMAGRVVTLILAWRFEPLISLGGLVTGVSTTVLFAMQAILRAAEVPPAELFRKSVPERRRWRATVGVIGLMALPFAGISSVILGSAVRGIGVLLIALAGLVALGLTLGGTAWVLLRILPTFGMQLVRMARNNMRRRGVSLVYAMIALFIGVFTLGFSYTVIAVSMEEYAQRSFSMEGYNLVVMADLEEEGAIRRALADHPIEVISARYQAPAKSIQISPVEASSHTMTPLLQGRGELLWDVTVDGAPWGSRPDGVYAPQGLGIPVGVELAVTGADGKERVLTVVGSYSPVEWDEGLIYPVSGLLVSKETLLELCAGTTTVTVAGEAAPSHLTSMSEAIGRALPQATVISSVDVDQMFSETLRSLFTFAVAMAGLALVAGMVLIANAVALAMIERHYEIGVLKAVGYTQRQVLTTIVLEYGLVALIASAAGVLAVQVFVLVLQAVQQMAGELLRTDLGIGALTMLIGVGITLLTALAVAWRPSQVRPQVVLSRGS